MVSSMTGIHVQRNKAIVGENAFAHEAGIQIMGDVPLFVALDSADVWSHPELFLLDEDLRPMLGNRIYGCDDCLAVCPWNKFASATRDANYWARVELQCPKLAHLVALDDKEFREVFSGSPIKRIGRNRFVRNVLYAIGNSNEFGLRDYARPLLDDEDPVVRDAAEWAMSRLPAQ